MFKCFPQGERAGVYISTYQINFITLLIGGLRDVLTSSIRITVVLIFVFKAVLARYFLQYPPQANRNVFLKSRNKSQNLISFPGFILSVCVFECLHSDARVW